MKPARKGKSKKIEETIEKIPEKVVEPTPEKKEPLPFSSKVWKIIESYFKEGLISHQLFSYNEFVNTNLEKVIRDESMVNINLDNKHRYVVYFGNVYVAPPCVIENREIRKLYPNEARLKDLSYESGVYVDVIELFFDENNKQTRKNITRRVLLAHIPVMLGSELCNLFPLSKEERIQKGECMFDTGGYFIIRGKERVLVSQCRNTYNKVMVFQQNNTSKKTESKYLYTSELRSMSSETGHSVSIKCNMPIDKKDITFTIPYISTEISAGILFKSMGFTEKDIISYIGLDNSYSEFLTNIIRASYHITSKDSALSYIGSHHIKSIPEDKRKAYATQVVEIELFPHLGITASIHDKAVLLGYMINKLIRTTTKDRKDDDRDNYANKRIETSGILLEEIFRTLLKCFLKKLIPQIQKRQEILLFMTRTVSSITQGLKHSFGTGSWGVQNNSYIRTGVSQILSRLSYGATISHLRRMMLPVGKEGKNVKIRQIHTSQYGFIDPSETPEGSSVGIVLNFAFTTLITGSIPTILVKEILDTFLNLSTDFSTNIFSTKVFVNDVLIGYSQNPEKTMELLKYLRKERILDKFISLKHDIDDNEILIYSDKGRMIRPLFTLNENGELKIKEETSLSWSYLVENDYIRYLDCMEVENSNIAMTPEEITPNSPWDFCEIHPSLMFGACSGIIPYPEHSQSPRICYQCLDINENVILADYSQKKIKDILIGDEVLTVNPVSLLISTTTVIHQYVKETTKQMIEILCHGKTLKCTYDHPVLTKQGWKLALEAPEIGFVENNIVSFYPVETRFLLKTTLIADITTASKNQSFITGNGFIVHNSSMGKQALSIFSTSYQHRTDTISHTLDYPQAPIIQTKPATFMGFNEMPSGINCVVAIMCYTGRNQEDSIIMNKASVERGLFSATTYRTFTCDEKKKGTNMVEVIEIPKERKKGLNYGKLDGCGIVRKGVYVKKNDVIIGKVYKKLNKEGIEECRDCSIVIKQGDEGFVDRIYDLTIPSGFRLVKVVIRTQRIPEVGDKFASRAGQKGVVGALLPQEDMPFSAEGIVPDIIINSHCIPSRMTTNQLLESVKAKIGGIKGEFGDATAWGGEEKEGGKDKAEEICDELSKLGYEKYGNEVLYNGFTGEPIKAKIFIGLTYYQRLKHMVSDKIHSRASGNVTMLTRQPTEGRSVDGGLRLGEMEKDALLVHGISKFLKERLFDMSDPYTITVCDKCGTMCKKPDYCLECKTDETSVCNLPYASKLLFTELMAVGIKISITAEK